MMPSTTPSNSRRQKKKIPSSASDLKNSSTNGALTEAPTDSPKSALTTVFTGAEKPHAAKAPQVNASISAHQGSGS